VKFEGKQVIFLYWKNQEEFYLELLTLLGKSKFRDIELADTQSLLKKLASGQLRRGKDFKPLSAFAKHQLFELRWTNLDGERSVGIRLICTRLDLSSVVLLTWHVKHSGQDTDFQRLNQDRACERAIMRKEEFFGKFNHAL
jgi:hypothetical protein